MSYTKRDRAYVEHCLRSIERFLGENDPELAGLTLDLAHPGIHEMADDWQAERLQAIMEALGRDAPEPTGMEIQASSFRLH